MYIIFENDETIKITNPVLAQENLKRNIFNLEVENKINELEKSQIKHDEQIFLLNAIKNGDESKIEPLVCSYEFVIYSCIKVFGRTDISVNNCFLYVRNFLEDYIERQVNSDSSEKSFFKFVVFLIQEKVKEFEIE